jgi:hypothetical protein
MSGTAAVGWDAVAEAVNVLGSVLMMICKSKVVSEGLVLTHFGKVALAVDQLVFMVRASGCLCVCAGPSVALLAARCRTAPSGGEPTKGRHLAPHALSRCTALGRWLWCAGSAGASGRGDCVQVHQDEVYRQVVHGSSHGLITLPSTANLVSMPDVVACMMERPTSGCRL